MTKTVIGLVLPIATQPESGWLDRYASLQRPPFKAGLREAIWNRYIPFREDPPFKAGSFNFPAKGGERQKHVSALIGALATGCGAPGF
jgi:hypothetical protein